MKNNKSNIIGDIGENLARLILAEIALVNRVQNDIGLDFFCELRDNPTFEFYIQSKGSENPTYRGNDYICSLSIDRTKIEDYWLEKVSPVFVFMSDIRKRHVYYLPITDETYQPQSKDSNSHIFQIPLSNRITRENSGEFVDEVVKLQPSLTTEQSLIWIEDYRKNHQSIYQDLDQIEMFLNIMRGSDQSSQVEAKHIIKGLYEDGKLDSARLKKGLIEIFRNCQNLSTQKHVVDTLVYLNSKEAIPEIIEQINRNINSNSYERTHPESRERFTSFLFNALVQLKANVQTNTLKKYLERPNVDVVRQASYAFGELRPSGGGNELIKLLKHPDKNVRITTAHALAKYGHKYILQECVKILESENDTNAIHGAIFALAYLKNIENIGEVIKYVSHEDSLVREAVAFYLGYVDSHSNADLLVGLAKDDDRKVQSQAGTSFIDSLTLPNLQKEKLVIPELSDVFEQGKEIKTASLLGLINRCGSKESLPLVLRIYQEDDGILTNHKIKGLHGGIKPIDLKTQALKILIRYEVPEIYDDIVRQISRAGKDVVFRYIDAAKEIGLPGIFDALITTKDENMLFWSNRIGQELVDLNRERAYDWASSNIKNNPSLPIFLVCCRIFKLIGKDNDITDIIRNNIWRLFQNPKNRLVIDVYQYLRDYDLAEATPLIIEDLNTGAYQELQETQAYILISQMLETIGTIGKEQGRDYLITLLPDVDPVYKINIINILSRNSDRQSMNAIKRCINDPDPDVRNLAKKKTRH